MCIASASRGVQSGVHTPTQRKELTMTANGTLVKATTGTEIAEFLPDSKLDLLKRTICKGATDDEFELFTAQCRRTGLDPFMRQIHAVKRWDTKAQREQMTVQVGIDGFRLIAHRTGEYRGQTPPQWCGKDGKWVDVWLKDEPPAAAKIGVFREGFECPLYRVVTWKSYAQVNRAGQYIGLWATMPDSQLLKCAEAVALRAAFPQELSGLYTNDEMAQADNETPAKATKPVRTAVKQGQAEETREPFADEEEINTLEPWQQVRELFKQFELVPYPELFAKILGVEVEDVKRQAAPRDEWASFKENIVTAEDADKFAAFIQNKGQQ